MAVQDDFRRQPPSTISRCDTREFLDDCPARIAELFHYWDGLCRGRATPARADFQPEVVPRHLSSMLLIVVEGIDDEGLGIHRYRVVGTDEVRLRGHDPTGKPVQDGFFWSSPEDALDCYETIRNSRQHLYGILEFVSPEGRRRSEHAVILPFSENSEDVSQVLVYSLARSARDR